MVPVSSNNRLIGNLVLAAAFLIYTSIDNYTWMFDEMVL
jgi:hypothetical protein